ncbi:hypothetical protein B723_12465 [Pseudomonas fluorescens NCIMB 11764]|uniref:Phage tail protein n=1 Tax=Pseudomonas fluorescens NCIMB 11764 TaxID=1221522 RepID=A0A0K1QN38_PSEFL|nr:tail fiber assembly protein [Pseudomonas fluorescens]AKV07179.1 hypothetical protein B723_12465 [Pseudomonas fluorescens NCIMB 11764]
MNFAVRIDGQGWRSVNGESDLLLGEVLTDVKPAETLPLPPSVEEVAKLAKVQRDKLLAVAANRMGPLQDAIDTDQASADEAARLVLWKGYRIDLNRIEEQATFPTDIDWPLSPDEALAD